MPGVFTTQLITSAGVFPISPGSTNMTASRQFCVRIMSLTHSPYGTLNMPSSPSNGLSVGPVCAARLAAEVTPGATSVVADEPSVT